MAKVLTAIFALAILGSGVFPDSGPRVTVLVEGGLDSVTVGERVPVRVEVLHSDTMIFAALEGERDLGELYFLGSGEKTGGVVGQGIVSDTLFAFAVPFRTGSVTIPPVKLLYETVGGLAGEVMSESTFINVKSVLLDDATDIRPLKANIPPPSELASYVVTGLLVCFALACVALVVQFLRRRKRPEEPVREVPSRPAHEIAFEELQRIEDLRLLSQGRFKEYYSLVSDTVRRYVGNRFGFDTMDMTTTELMYHLSEKRRRAPIGELRDFLNQSDLVKFARLVPPYGEMEGAISVARRLVKSMIEVGTQEDLPEHALSMESDG